LTRIAIRGIISMQGGDAMKKSYSSKKGQSDGAASRKRHRHPKHKKY